MSRLWTAILLSLAAAVACCLVPQASAKPSSIANAVTDITLTSINAKIEKVADKQKAWALIEETSKALFINGSVKKFAKLLTDLRKQPTCNTHAVSLLDAVFMRPPVNFSQWWLLPKALRSLMVDSFVAVRGDCISKFTDAYDSLDAEVRKIIEPLDGKLLNVVQEGEMRVPVAADGAVEWLKGNVVPTASWLAYREKLESALEAKDTHPNFVVGPMYLETVVAPCQQLIEPADLYLDIWQILERIEKSNKEMELPEDDEHSNRAMHLLNTCRRARSAYLIKDISKRIVDAMKEELKNKPQV